MLHAALSGARVLAGTPGATAVKAPIGPIANQTALGLACRTWAHWHSLP
jgi:hypothetical protein